MEDKILVCLSVVRARIQTLREELGYTDMSNNALANEARLEDRPGYVHLAVELGNLLIVQPLIISFAMNGGENMSLENQNLVNILLNKYAHQTQPIQGEIDQATNSHSITNEMGETSNSTEGHSDIVQCIFGLFRFLCAALLSVMSSSSASASNDYAYNGGKIYPFDPDNMPGKFHDHIE